MRSGSAVCSSAALVVLVISATGWCALGETEGQISAQYGKPYKEMTDGIGLGDKLLIYEADGRMIGVLFFNGASVSEEITFLDQRRMSRTIEEADIAAIENILAANAGGSDWQRQAIANPQLKYFWQRRDGSAVALVHNARPTTITLVDQRFRALQEKARSMPAGSR